MAVSYAMVKRAGRAALDAPDRDSSPEKLYELLRRPSPGLVSGVTQRL
jgi:hypothetical protein